VTPPPVIRIVQENRPLITLEEYRQRMLAERKLSIDRPAFYLDRSSTGTGKSTVDLRIIEELIALTGGLL
ncbi:MAG TPA: hypothetical protein DD473_05010, partial [Planctomycetaceae bacterium]|nr:hypothetical protein [Planctomycetaceae bacterium]